MKKINPLSIVLIGASIVVFSMIVALTEGNYMMLKQITPDSSMVISFIKGFGFSIAALIIIVFDDRKFVKLMFVVLDSLMIFCLQYFSTDVWSGIGAFIYAPYTGLNLYFIGMIVSSELKSRIKKDDNDTELIEAQTELSSTITRLALTVNQLDRTKAKLKELLNARLLNAKRGRGDSKDAKVKEIEEEIKFYIENNGEL